ncbi:MAG: cytochrome c [Ancalomicrobiaceae bacterium]|nr:cytochrome c [Ancalomicrobiaceae bacterium]
MALKLTSAIAAFLIAGFASTAFSADDPIKLRQETMKAIGGAVGSLVKMVKGETPFDAAAAQQALGTVATKAKGIDIASYFPAGSDKGKTEAKATIWSDPDGFKAALAKLQTVSAEQAKTAPQSVDDIKKALAAVGPACSNCHDTYREKKS